MVKTTIFVSLFFLFGISKVFASQEFMGAVDYDYDVFGCDMKYHLQSPYRLSQADADRQAINFCDTFQRKPVRVTDFADSKHCWEQAIGEKSLRGVYTVVSKARYNCL